MSLKNLHPFYLTEITTDDGIVLQGMFFSPQHAGKRAVVWVHGLTGKFYGEVRIMNEMLAQCGARGWGFASFNNRGHDLIASLHKIDPRKPGSYRYINGGAGYETFSDCAYDIRAMVEYMLTLGYTEIILAGHSTGALKVCYAEGTKPHDAVTAIVLSGPLSDRLDPSQDPGTVTENIKRMTALVTEGKGDVLLNGLFFFPMTPKRYLSLFSKTSPEAVFDYDSKKPQMKVFRSITKPVCVIISQHDEYLDRPATEILDVFRATTRSRAFTGKEFLASNHGFDGKQEELARFITGWIDTV